MNGVNLIPLGRREAKANKAHLLKLASALVIYGALLLGGYFLCIRYVALDSQPLDSEIRTVAAGLNASSCQVLVLTEELDKAQQKLQAAQAVGQQPDWGSVLRAVAQNLGDQIVLDLCRLQKVPPVSQSPANDEVLDGSFLLEVSGWAKAQADVSAYVLRLEQTGLFGKVKLVKTTRQLFLGQQAVAFRLECIL
jgi:Tfp pilus assembly protein PilN